MREELRHDFSLESTGIAHVVYGKDSARFEFLSKEFDDVCLIFAIEPAVDALSDGEVTWGDVEFG